MDQQESLHFKFILVIIILFINLNVSCITIQEKLALNKIISQAKSHLYNNQYKEAKDLFVDIKNTYPTTEFSIIADYFLAQIAYKNNDKYPALYHIERCLETIEDKRLHQSYKENIILLAGILYTETGLPFEAKKQFEFLLKSSSLPIVCTSRLYLGFIEYEAGNHDSARFYLTGIKKDFLGEKERERYDYLIHFIGWSKIETKNIGYGDPNVSTLYAQHDLLYIGLWNGGLIEYNYILNTHHFYRAPVLTSDEVRAVYPVGNSLWIGTTNGISILNKRDNSITEKKEFEKMKITSIIGDKEKIYIGTLGDGIFSYDLSANKIYPLISGKNISTIYKDDELFLFSTYDGKLFSIEKGLVKEIRRFKKKGKPPAPIMEIKKNELGEICLATYGNGIILYNEKTKKTYHFSQKKNNFIKNDYFLTVAQKNNIFYCGSLGNGVYCLENGILRRFPVSDYYLGHDIQKILFYHDYMFLATLGEGVLVKVASLE